jgi:RND family efflux transporter MFP subunit
MRNLILFSLLALIFGSLGGCVDREAQERSKVTQAIVTDRVRAVAVEPAQVGAVAETASITGEIVTSDDAQIGAKQSGRVVSVHVRDGDRVVAGQVIARLDSVAARAQLQQAMANLASARAALAQARQVASVVPTQSNAAIASAEAQLRSTRAQLQKALEGARPEERRQAQAQVSVARSNLETAKKDLERTLSLVEQGALAAARLDQAQNAYQTALAQYESALDASRLVEMGVRDQDLQIAREGVRQAEEALNSARAQQRLDGNLQQQVISAQASIQAVQAQVDLARESVADTEVRAPFTGRISGSPIQPGTVVGPGTPVARVVGVQGTYFEGEVPETVVAQLQPGQPVSVQITALPDRLYAGRIEAINPAGERTGRLFRARIALLGATADVKPGMFAQGQIVLRRDDANVVVPESALLREGDRSYLFVMRGEDTVERIAVTPGVRSGGRVSVAGLGAGERVVVKGQEGLISGAKVKVEQSPAPAGIR